MFTFFTISIFLFDPVDYLLKEISTQLDLAHSILRTLDIQIYFIAISLDYYLFLFFLLFVFFIARGITLFAVVLINLQIIIQVTILFKVIVSKKGLDEEANVGTETNTALNFQSRVNFGFDWLVDRKFFFFWEVNHIVTHVHHHYVAEALQVRFSKFKFVSDCLIRCKSLHQKSLLMSWCYFCIITEKINYRASEYRFFIFTSEFILSW